MDKKYWNYMTISIVVIFVLLIVATAYTNGFNYSGLDLLKFAIIIIIGSVALFYARKKEKEMEGFPLEDEMSLLYKYKVGYYAYVYSMYMWFIIFIFKDKFPDVETMLGGGILLSALISFIVGFVIKRRLNT